jgi:hypothetical protein
LTLGFHNKACASYSVGSPTLVRTPELIKVVSIFGNMSHEIHHFYDPLAAKNCKMSSIRKSYQATCGRLRSLRVPLHFISASKDKSSTLVQ